MSLSLPDTTADPAFVDATTIPPDPNLDPEAAAREAAVLAQLAALGIPAALYRHPPLFTVEDSRELRGDLPGAHVKNMFLKGKAGDLWLVTCLERRAVHMRDLEKEIGARKLSFGKPELLFETLGVRPGAVTPLAVLNDRPQKVGFVLDAAAARAEVINCHPLHNAATVALATADLLRLCTECGHPPRILDFDALEAKAEARARAAEGPVAE